MKELLLRLKLPMNNFWKTFQRWCAILFVIFPTANTLATALDFFPEGFIPTWVKGTIGGMLFMGFILPQLTVANAQVLDEAKKKAQCEKEQKDGIEAEKKVQSALAEQETIKSQAQCDTP